MLDFKRFCQDYQINLEEDGHHGRPGWLQTNCIWCPDGRSHTHLGFNTAKGFLYCWQCGGHSAWSFVSTIIKSADKKAVGQIMHKYDMTPNKIIIQQEITRPKQIKLPAGTGPLTKQHKKYLLSRNYNPDKLEKLWDLSGTTYLSGRWNWRIIIPIKNVSGHVVAYQGRSIKPNHPKRYLFCKDNEALQNPHTLIYGIDKVPADNVLIVEGVTGVWRLGPGTVATFGIAWRIEQALILRQYKRRFILFDPEERAQERALKLAKWLCSFPGRTEIITGFKTDPGEFSDRKARHIVKNLGIR